MPSMMAGEGAGTVRGRNRILSIHTGADCKIVRVYCLHHALGWNGFDLTRTIRINQSFIKLCSLNYIYFNKIKMIPTVCATLKLWRGKFSNVANHVSIISMKSMLSFCIVFLKRTKISSHSQADRVTNGIAKKKNETKNNKKREKIEAAGRATNIILSNNKRFHFVSRPASLVGWLAGVWRETGPSINVIWYNIRKGGIMWIPVSQIEFKKKKNDIEKLSTKKWDVLGLISIRPIAWCSKMWRKCLFPVFSKHERPRQSYSLYIWLVAPSILDLYKQTGWLRESKLLLNWRTLFRNTIFIPLVELWNVKGSSGLGESRG